MNTTPAQDPFLHDLDGALHGLAARADDDVVGDRMSAIRRRHRSRVVVRTGLAAVALVGMAGLGVLVGSQFTKPPVIVATPAPTSTHSPAPAATTPSVQQIDIAARVIDATHIAVAKTIITTNRSPWTTDDGLMMGEPITFTAILVDGVEVDGSDGGAQQCVVGTAAVAGREVSAFPEATYKVKGPGTHSIEVRSGWCSARGLVETRQTVTVVTP